MLPLNYYDTSASGVGVILGEGKPENQNSAIIYCAGSLLQTIDMNQDNSLAQVRGCVPCAGRGGIPWTVQSNG